MARVNHVFLTGPLGRLILGIRLKILSHPCNFQHLPLSRKNTLMFNTTPFAIPSQRNGEHLALTTFTRRAFVPKRRCKNRRLNWT